MSCNENYYELIGTIEALPDGDTTFLLPFNLDKKSNAPVFSIVPGRKIKLPMKRMSGSLKESVSSSVSGKSYEVTVKWNIEKVDRETYAVLDCLKNNINHLIVNSFLEGGLFVRAVPESYNFDYYENEGVISCELTTINTTGVQRMG